MDVADLPMPVFQNIESQHKYLFAEPHPLKHIIFSMLNPGVLSMSPIVDVACYFEYEEAQVETPAKKPKVAAKRLLDGRAYAPESAMQRY